MTTYAVDLRSPRDKKQPAKRKRDPQAYDPLHEGATIVGAHMYEGALQLSRILAPDHPADAEELPDDVQWEILELTAFEVTPHTWEDPNAIEDLIRLRKKFAPRSAASSEYLKPVAKLRRTEKRNLPDLNVTMASPDWDQRSK